MSRGFCGLCDQPFDDDFEPHLCEASARLGAEERKVNEAAIRADERAKVLEEVARALEKKSFEWAGRSIYPEAAAFAALAVQIRLGTFPTPLPSISTPSTEER